MYEYYADAAAGYDDVMMLMKTMNMVLLMIMVLLIL